MTSTPHPSGDSAGDLSADGPAVETHFLGADAPLLPAAASFLKQRFSGGGQWDLGQVTCVLPTVRGKRRLQECLDRAADEAGLVLRPPTLLTVGQLPDRLYRPAEGSVVDGEAAPAAGDVRLAEEFERALGWTRVLRSAKPGELTALMPTVPDHEPLAPWLELARTLARLDAELAAHRLSFAEVAGRCETNADRRRWEQLAEFHRRYLVELSRGGRQDVHEARREAIRRGRCRASGPVLLIGTTDLSPLLCEMLSVTRGQVWALVAASPEQADRFDRWGVVKAPRWKETELPLRDEQLVSAGDVSDQASVVAEALAEYSTRYAADQVTVGVTDESQVGTIEVQLRGCGVGVFRHLGWTVAETAVGRLVTLTATFLQRRSWESLAALVRHADVHALLTERLAEDGGERGQAGNRPQQRLLWEEAKSDDVADPEDWLADLDRLLANHFPVRVDQPLPKLAAKRYPRAVSMAQEVRRWLAPLQQGDPQPIAAWSDVLQRWLETVYPARLGQERADGGSGEKLAPRTLAALAATRDRLQRLSQLSGPLDLAVRGPAALEMLAGWMLTERVQEPARPDDVEILGWLDLTLDDAPALVVAGLNHPFVPEAVASHPYLPAGLRNQLRSEENERRYARDLQAMSLMITSRPEVRFVVGRRSADGSPTPPSRLLAASPAEDAARRVRLLLGHQRVSQPVADRYRAGPERTELPVPPIGQPVQLEALSVTAFRDYLQCPYRFYLRHVLRLRPLDDSSTELAANQFGDLVHGALERFGLSKDRNASDPDKIERCLLQHLDEYAWEQYGEDVSTAVRLQWEQARRRLQVVARRQAQRVADGWRIHAVEAQVDERGGVGGGPAAGIEVDGEFLAIRGRFDRIDYHRQQDRWAVLDYKTHGEGPEKKHLRSTPDGETWIDLQLPLYRRLIPFLGIDADPERVDLGYFNVGEKEAETGVRIAAFTPQQLDDADRLIEDCIRGIRAGRFEPTGDRVPFDDYGMILQTGVTQRALDAIAEEGLAETEGGA